MLHSRKHSTEIRLGYLNAWAGCIEAGPGKRDHVVDFLEAQVHDHDIFAISEVHFSGDLVEIPRFIHPKSPGHRPGPIDTQLGNRLKDRLEGTHAFHFVPHFSGALHDCEKHNERLHYGNVLVVKNAIKVKLVEECTLHHNPELNTEECLADGRYSGSSAARKAFVMTFKMGNVPVTLLTPHGIWSRQGKVDLPARIAQNDQMAGAISRHLKRFQQNKEPHTIIMGDLNYESNMKAVTDLCSRTEIFGKTPGTHTNKKHGITDTRHPVWYPRTKLFREADFIFVSKALERYEVSYRVEKRVPSDHAMLTYVVNTKLPYT